MDIKLPKSVPAQSQLISIMKVRVLTCSSSRPPDPGREKSHKPYSIKVEWIGSEEVDGEVVNTSTILKIGSFVDIPKGNHVLLVTVVKVDYSTYYTVHKVIDDSKSISSLFTGVKPAGGQA